MVLLFMSQITLFLLQKSKKVAAYTRYHALLMHQHAETTINKL